MTQRRNNNHSKTARPSQLRIIGGQWRGRKLSFTPAEGLRPTSDRVRETLFNWLAADIRGARCLDLFSGSGALGLEALSRGAAHCDFVDNNPSNLRQISSHLNSLQCSPRASCHSLSAEAFLAQAKSGWDIVFIDPPFGLKLAAGVCHSLQQNGLLLEHAQVYLETGIQEELPQVPTNWLLHRDKRAGEVRYQLYHCR